MRLKNLVTNSLNIQKRLEYYSIKYEVPVLACFAFMISDTIKSISIRSLGEGNKKQKMVSFSFYRSHTKIHLMPQLDN